MAGKICPVYSTDQRRECMGEDCMLYIVGQSSNGCALVKAPRQVVSRLDTLTAQVQEIQVVLNMLTNK